LILSDHQFAGRRPHYAAILAVLLALFCLRVLAQLVQACAELPFLPPFEAWQSGAVPYELLLVSQVLIIMIYAWILRRIWTNKIRANRRMGWVFLLVGLIYFAVMALRLVIGLAGLSAHHWFHSYLPTFFHFVLAGYLIVVGSFHLHGAARTG
jgi:hypothetical protein